VNDEGVAALLDRCRHVAVADGLERRRGIVAPLDGDDLVELGAGIGRQRVEDRHRPDLHHVDLGRPAVLQ
jgi:hypothetical protein